MKKDKTIETLRGGAILLVVVGHVIGSTAEGGMKVSDDSFYRYLYDSIIDPIQLPLFTILAGWVYSLKPITYEHVSSFIVKKVFRLIVPMLVVGMCYFFVQNIIPGTNYHGELTNVWKLLFFPYTMFWFLYSLFFIFIIVALLDVNKKMNTILSWSIVFCFSIIVLLIRDVFIPIESPNYFSYKGTLYLLPSFILGVGLNRFKTLFQSKMVVNVSIVLLIVCVLIQQLSWFNLIDFAVQKDDVVGLLIGFTSGIVLLKTRIEINWLVWVGSFAYTIYLFHGFGTAGGRILPKMLYLNTSMIIFFTSLTAGLLFPMLVDKYFNKNKLTRILFLGKNNLR